MTDIDNRYPGLMKDLAKRAKHLVARTLPVRKELELQCNSCGRKMYVNQPGDYTCACKQEVFHVAERPTTFR